MWCLTIDLGATFIKGAAVDLDTGRMAHVIRRPFPSFATDRASGVREVPIAEVVSAVGSLLEELVNCAPEANSVFWCGQMHGLVLCDGVGRPLSDFISWQDQRSVQTEPGAPASSYDVLQNLVTHADLVDLGREFSPRHPVATLHWLTRQGRLPRGAYAASLTDFMVAHFAKVPPLTHPTNASAHGLFSLIAGNWHMELIERIGLGMLAWPEIAREMEPTRQIQIGGRRLTCYPGIGDQQAALLGADLREDELSLNIATGSQVSLLTRDLRLGDYQVRPFPGGKYLQTVTHLPAGRALNALLGLLGELPAAQGTPLRQPWELVSKAVSEVSSTDLTADLAFFNCAVGQEGGLSHLREDNLRVGHLFLAAFLNMAHNYHDAALRLAPRQDWTRVVFSGGLAQKLPALRAGILERLGSNHRVVDEPEDTLAGLRNLARSVLPA